MRGFTDKGLIIFPDYSLWEFKTSSEKDMLLKQVNVVIEYMKGVGITPYIFNNDEYAVELLSSGDLKVYNVMSAFVPEDLAFARRGFLEGLEMAPDGEINLSLVKKVRESIPVKRGQTEEKRFEDVVKRCKMICRQVIESFKFVVSFESTSKEVYGVYKGTINDERIIWRFTKVNTIQAYMSGIPIPIQDLTGYVNAGLPLEKWNVEEAINGNQT